MASTGSFTVGVLGAGHVGSAVANALVLLGACRRVVLFDRTLDRAEAEAWDIEDGVPLLDEVELAATNNYADLADADIVVVTVGDAKIVKSRLELLATNASVIREAVDALDDVAPEAILILTTNPVDVLTRIAIERSSRPPNLILGTGTLLETARLSHQLGRVLEVNEADVHAYVIGEHGQSAFPVWSSAAVGSVKLDDFSLPTGDPVSTIRDELVEGVLRRGLDIIQRKGYTSQGVAVAAVCIVRCIRRDQRQLLVVSSQPRPEYGIGDVVLGLPCIVGRSGIQHQLVISLTADEKKRLEHSARVLDDAYRVDARLRARLGTG
ncbi:MAG TPA: NAD(P)-binding domain-containing protein [Acidimicrobiales bacterium]|nr:NAD(P)-binding domain-containing protein [Acidimicrobiales bacterium]